MSEGTRDELVPTKAGRVRTVAAGVVGNVLEWYDFALYGFFAPTIGRLFFPSESRVASLLATYGVFALAFALRPVGGVIFGHIGDRIGRKKALELSVLLMAVPTTLLGLLPTYHDIGLAAPIALTLIRGLQGISVGGEFIGSISFLGEHAPASRRGLLGSWTSCSATLGTLLGSGVAALVNETLPPAWGWRVPFGRASSSAWRGSGSAWGSARAPTSPGRPGKARSPARRRWRRSVATAGRSCTSACRS